MNISALRYFVQVAHSKNISKAAQELFITQPALSRHLQRLEKELGVALFERSRGKMTCEVTEAGKSCLYDAEQILFHADSMFSAAQPYSRGEKGTLRVGFGGLEGDWLLEWFREIRTVYPQIEIKPQQANWRELAQGIVDKSLDLAFFMSGFPFPGSKCVHYVELYPAKLQIIVSKDHPLSERREVTIDDLKGLSFISYTREVAPGSYDAFNQLCMQHGFLPNYVASYNNSKMILSDIYANRGFGIYASPSQEQDKDRFSVINVHLAEDGPWSNSKFCLVYHRDSDLPCLQNVIKLIPQIGELSGQHK